MTREEIISEEASNLGQRMDRVESLFREPSAKYHFSVPSDYVHEKQLERFNDPEKFSKGTFKLGFFPDRTITDEGFKNVSVALRPGNSYYAKFYKIVAHRVEIKDYLLFLKMKGALLVGAQGLTLVHQLLTDKFPAGEPVFTVDEEKNNLFKNGEGYYIPSLYQEPGVFNILRSSLSKFDSTYRYGVYLLGVFKNNHF